MRKSLSMWVFIYGALAVMLVYNLPAVNELFQRFGGIDGSAYFVGGFGFRRGERRLAAPPPRAPVLFRARGSVAARAPRRGGARVVVRVQGLRALEELKREK